MKPAAMERTSSIKQFCDDLMGIDFIPILNISSSMLEFGKEKSDRAVKVESNIGWTVYSDKEWCKASKSNNNIIISVNKNKESGSRTCDVIITGSSYQVSQVIRIKQKGTGTVVFPKDPTWWELNSKKVYGMSGVIIAGCLIAGLCFYFKPDYEKESRLLTQAIENKDGQALAKYADLDSIRAFLPYAEFLYKQGDRENSLRYATKARALGGQTSILAEELMTVLNAEIEHIHQETILPQESISENTETPSTDEPEPNSETVAESNDEKFARASNDFNLLLSLAKDNYAKAYYPLAKMYYDRKNLDNAKLWAKKALNANVNRNQAQSLLSKIETQAEPSNDDLFSKATTLEDFRLLANKGYKKAYAPLAEQYLKKREYDSAHQWAVKAGNAKVGLEKARKVIEILSSYGYYDGDEHGGKPNF